jgi:hypothetical protein
VQIAVPPNVSPKSLKPEMLNYLASTNSPHAGELSEAKLMFEVMGQEIIAELGKRFEILTYGF